MAWWRWRRPGEKPLEEPPERGGLDAAGTPIPRNCPSPLPEYLEEDHPLYGQQGLYGLNRSPQRVVGRRSAGL
jgi:hypothetical protein